MSGQYYQMLRFALIGVSSTLLYFGLLVTLQPIFQSILLLTAICYVAAMVFNFLAQGMFTFQLRKFTGRQIGRYGMMHVCALVVNSLAMSFIVNVLNVHILMAQVFVTGVVTTATFLLSRKWVYT